MKWYLSTIAITGPTANGCNCNIKPVSVPNFPTVNLLGLLLWLFLRLAEVRYGIQRNNIRKMCTDIWNGIITIGIAIDLGVKLQD